MKVLVTCLVKYVAEIEVDGYNDASDDELLQERLDYLIFENEIDPLKFDIIDKIITEGPDEKFSTPQTL